MNLETDRLIIRPAIFDDFPFLLSFYNHKNNMQFIQSGKHDWTQNELLKKWDQLNKNKNIGLRIIIEKETGSIIGECGLLQLKDDQPNHIEIGYMIDEQYWNKGYGSEIVKALIHYGKNEMQLSELNAGVNVGNIYSIRILENCGFNKISAVVSEKKEDYLLYSIQM